MSEHEAFRGVYVDHLYRDCPSLTRAITKGSTPCCAKHKDRLGTRMWGTVDPLGTDICGMCVHRWKRKHREGAAA
jgi:hypothetical protein